MRTRLGDVALLMIFLATFIGHESCSIPNVSHGNIGIYEKQYPRLPIHRKMQLAEGSKVEDGTEVYLSCESKYEPFGTTNPEEKIYCNHGEWNRYPRCEPATCRMPPPQAANATLRKAASDRGHGAVVIYDCKSHFKKYEFGKVTCQFGAWVGNVPNCKDTRCDVNSLVSYSIKKPNKSYYNSHDFFISICETGFTALKPNHIILCLNGEWKGLESLPCSPANCWDEPPKIENGQIANFTRHHTSEVAYTCNEFFMLKDSDSKIECKFGKWIGVKPTCQENPCVNGCGKNAICVVENHQKRCNCPEGMTGDAYGRGCKDIRFCESHPCHTTAKCVDTKGSYKCQCPMDYIGDPYREGCRRLNSCPRGDQDCRSDAACQPDASGVNMCKNLCEKANCGSNAHCEMVNHRARCFCPYGFQGDPDSACLRVSVSCQDTKDCRDNQACVNGQCRLFCDDDNECAFREKCIGQSCFLACFAHSECPEKEACLPSGYCQVGCRDNKDCPYTETCIKNQCQNPCEIKGVCGLNEVCTVVDHKEACECLPGFEGSPYPVLGCKRVYQKCSAIVFCPPGLNCIGNRCRALCGSCVDGEVCVSGVCLVICSMDNNCPVSEICINKYCQVGCRTNGDCRWNEVCGAKKCTCRQGFNLTPSGCSDNNECLSNPCHPTSLCVNTAGNYSCHCKEGDIGDGYTGCRSLGECPNGDRDCPTTGACGLDDENITKCINPCDTKPCGPNAYCNVSNHVRQCFCPKMGLFTGNPYKASKGCIKVDCLQDKDCRFERKCINFVCKSRCDTKSLASFSIRNGFKRYYRSNETLKPICKRGFTAMYPKNRLMCLNGDWKGLSPLPCTPANCSSKPPKIENGHAASFTRHHSSEVTYECNEFFVLNDSDSKVQCKFGKWIGTKPTCQKHGQNMAACKWYELIKMLPDYIDFKEIRRLKKNDAPYGFGLNLKCVANKRLVGKSDKAKCKHGGQWEIPKIKCVVFCAPVEKLPDSNVIIDSEEEFYRIGEIVTFSCPPGQILNSEVHRVMCLPMMRYLGRRLPSLSARWSHEVMPTCVNKPTDDYGTDLYL